MNRQRIGWRSVIGGALLAVAGTVWALQGAGVIGGSAMNDNTLWLVIGLPVAALGAFLVWRGVRS